MTVFLVCGGRTFGHFFPSWRYTKPDIYKQRCIEYKFVFDTLTRLAGQYAPSEPEQLLDIEVVHGTANGADSVGEEWGMIYYTKLKPFPPDFDTHGSPAAFFVRNQEMADYCYEKASSGIQVVCIPFKGGTGTDDMVKRIMKANAKLDRNKIIIEDMRNEQEKSI